MQTPREPTLNDRVRGLVVNLNDLCEEAESFLARVSPRPPIPPGPNRIEKVRGAGDIMPLVHNVNDLEEVTQRLRQIIVELRQIA